ncbi:hypothetical protein KC722_01265 [Candidatus Kaiserbacteria bacterium]|nr:hypothetical protein [Candidatus Kaiserbacteria bacterium]MCB9811802.1 hypothetical protein [Candidatus Nomurabacteria bacterium]
MQKPLEITESFDIDSIPNLDVVVLAALELLQTTALPALNIDAYKKPLVIGSGNALQTGKILFSSTPARFADESTYHEALAQYDDIDTVVVVSASGSKHASGIAKTAKDSGKDVVLLTNNPAAPAAEFVAAEHIHVFPKNREPYTYNTSTYLSMIFAETGESPATILSYIMQSVEPQALRNFADYRSYVFILPARFEAATAMVRTKFDELFGPYVQGRVFTDEEIKHAKTVVTSGDELFIALGSENKHYGVGKNRICLELPAGAGYATVIAASYYLVGLIQKAHPPFFKDNIEAYTQTASEIFGHEIKPIVE